MLKERFDDFSMMTHSKVRYKHSDLFDMLNVFFEECLNLT